MARRRWLPLFAFRAFLAFLPGCAPPACSDTDERAMRHDVEILVKDDGDLADAARARLVRRGPAAIPIVETGLYSAEPPARRRLIRTFAEIGSPEAAPVLAHLAAHDSDPDVQAAAQRALAGLPSH